jgi:hypothetical protein
VPGVSAIVLLRAVSSYDYQNFYADIFKYRDWRKLGRIIIELEETFIDYNELSDSEILFIKS